MGESNNFSAVSVNVGEVVTGKVERIMPYGAFVRLATGQKAMIHISELSRSYVKKVEDVLQVDQEVRAKVIKIDEKGRIDLSIKQLEVHSAPPPQDGDDFEKKLSNFLKASEQKIADLNSKSEGKKGDKRRGKR